MAAQILLLQLLVVVVVVAGGLGLAYLDARRDQNQQAGQTVSAIASGMADSPTVREAVAGSDPTAVLQPYAEQVRADTGTDFVVVMTPSGRRWTHPTPSQIGGHYLGSIASAQRGQAFVEQYTGTLGPSVRAVVPVFDSAGERRVVALVAVGITTAALERSLWSALPPIVLAAAGVLVVGSIGAWLVSRRLRRQTHGLAGAELDRMLDYYDAVLHAVREGLLLLDRDDRVRLVNDEGRRLLGLDLAEPVGRSVSELGLPADLVQRLSGPTTVHDEMHLVDARILVVNRRPARRQNQVLGSVITFRDHTELRAVSGELDAVRSLAESLRSQNHEAANRLHTVVSLVEIGRTEDAVEFATRELELAQRLTDQMVGAVDDPVLAALLLGKTAQAAERGVALELTTGSQVGMHVFGPGDLVTLLGNLLDNAIDAVTASGGQPLGRPPQVAVRLQLADERLEIDVDDSGPGVDPGEVDLIFERGWSSKATGSPPIQGATGRGIGLALVVQTVRRLGGTVQVSASHLGGAGFRIRVGVGVTENAPVSEAVIR